VAERAFGFRAEVCAGQPLSKIIKNQALHLATDQMRYQHDAQRRTCQIPLSNEHILFATISPILIRGGALQGWVLVMQDITHSKEMEQFRTDMILTASHELRNPINLTSGALELLEKQFEALTNGQQEALDLAKLGVERAAALISDLLDLEHIERRMGMKMKRCNCTLLLSSIGLESRLWAQNHGATLQMRIPDSPLIVWGDERLLQRVMSNLVDNAFKYTPPGGRVTVEARAEAGQVIVQVSDTGPGIPQEAQPYVFKRFFRLSDQPDGIKGTGLGLTIVKSIVEQHGGRVWVTSQPGQGSTFTVSLPAFDK
jgi:signal transduction histidine kinase